ncbi:MAG: branched-chain amino acid transport system II carrier protein [Tissierellia bacterium]|nr:branched-chain amino acid transport system II carrier protein [Tissierellia bacterium]
MKKLSTKDILVVGFALFAMFFGAGNLIFPPYLGSLSGENWLTSDIGFVITGVGMTLLGVVATARVGGKISDVTHKLGPVVGNLMSFLIIICIGPLLAIPRNAATTHEIAFYGTDFPIMATSLVFFLLVLFFTLRPSKIVDAIGRFLTPALLIILALMIVKGVMSPLGSPLPNEIPTAQSFAHGFTEGYQTMDTMAATVFTGIIVSSIIAKGYKEEQVTKVTILSGLIAIVGLAVVYTGLAYLGASYPTGGVEIDRSALLISIMAGLFGNAGQLILALCISLACLTTAIGLTTASADFFVDMTGGKVSYNAFAIGTAVFSGVFSVLGVDAIVSLSAPILGILYPCLIVLLVLASMDQQIPYPTIYYFGVLGAFLVSFPEGMAGVLGNQGLADFFASLPLAQFGLGWLIPSVVGVVLGYFVGKAKYPESKVS